MESWQFFLATLKSSSIVSSIPLYVCFVSQLERCSYVSFHELILRAQPSRRSFPIEFLSVVIVLDKGLESKDAKINMMQLINIFEKSSWIMKIALDLCPLFLLPYVLNLG